MVYIKTNPCIAPALVDNRGLQTASLCDRKLTSFCMLVLPKAWNDNQFLRLVLAKVSNCMSNLRPIKAKARKSENNLASSGNEWKLCQSQQACIGQAAMSKACNSLSSN